MEVQFQKVAMQNTFFKGHLWETASDVFIRDLFIFYILYDDAPMNRLMMMMMNCFCGIVD